ncbi:amidohydrolase [Maricurvus nonylphenolicus]|uniref:amidohydrolase n=1 Tax=Maricurvus nonylphenolicus TaxID=1008307 RepID=UPI0036F32BEE
MLIRSLIGLATALLTYSPTTTLAAPDKVYFNGNVITVDEQFSIVDGFATEGDKFSVVGSSDLLLALADKDTEIIDLQGRTVIPGLIDNHNHYIRGSYHWSSAVRLDGISFRTEALQRLQEHAKQLKKDEWLLVLGGWNQEQFADDPRGFTRQELDQITGNRPAFIQAQYSHAFVNSAFLKLIDAPIQASSKKSKITANSAIDKLFGPPLNTLVERDQQGIATSRLNGGMGMVLQASTLMPALAKEKALESARSAQQFYNALGITSVYDPAGALASKDAYEAIEYLHQSNELSLRVFRTASLSSINTAMINRALQLRMLPDWLSNFVLGLIRDVDSTADSIKALNNLPDMNTGDNFYDHLAIGELLYVPMHDTLDSEITKESITDYQRTEVMKLLSSMLDKGLSAQIHVVNALTIDFYLDIIEELSSNFPLQANQITFTHAEGITDALLKRSKQLGISVQVRSMPIIRSAKAVEESYGADVLSMPPLRMIQESGITWGLGTDGTKASQIEPMRTLYWATRGRAINGEQILEEAQLLSREEALIAHTRSNAALLNRSDILGQIRPGYLADFVVLGADYLSVELEQIPTIEVQQTVVSGKTVYLKQDK